MIIHPQATLIGTPVTLFIHCNCAMFLRCQIYRADLSNLESAETFLHNSLWNWYENKEMSSEEVEKFSQVREKW